MVYADYYGSHNPWYYILQITIIIYGAGLIANIVLVMNTSVPNTAFKTLPGGPIHSLRYSSFQWTIFMLAGFKYFMYPAVNQMILYRRSRGCSIFWYAVIFSLVLINFFVVLGLARFYSSCNGQGQIDNPCTSKVYCCAQEIWSVSTNNCINTQACTAGFPATQADLRPNVDFIWYFSVSVAFLAFDLFFVGFFGGVFHISPIPRAITKRQAMEEGLNSEKGVMNNNNNKMTKGE